MKIIECPRDAMQGIHEFIPTESKIAYINSLLKIGFDTIDFGSFVSPKAIPQMRDTAEVLNSLDLNATRSKLLAIIANIRGAQDAVEFDEISYFGFPFSISETFQIRNTNSSISEALQKLEEIQNLCFRNRKELVVYISMAFGNPYGDNWNKELVVHWAGQLKQLGIKTIALADTIGASNKVTIFELFSSLISMYPEIEFGAHLHSRPETAYEKIEAAHSAGCKRFDVAIRGLGGCPMADDKLVGNIATEALMLFLKNSNELLDLDEGKLSESYLMADKIFNV
jgi:hydroxymethylglutaryl-CoA lyase